MREKFGAFLVLVWHFGLEWLVQFPPHSAQTGPKPSFLFKFITLVKHNRGHNPENRPNKLHFPPIAIYSDSVLAVLYAAVVRTITVWNGTFAARGRRSHRLGGYFNLEKFSLPAQNRPRSMKASVAGPVDLHLQNQSRKKPQKKNESIQ